MPKAHNQRPRRPVSYRKRFQISRRRFQSRLRKRFLNLRKRFLFKFTVVHFVIAMILAGLLITWGIRSYNTADNKSGSQLQSAQSYVVVGVPSINADFINRVLDRYHSPAAGKGQALYDYGVKYHIDPVYALAFFMHESTFGTRGVATVTRSLGNIRATAEHEQYQGYRLYRTWEEGFEDWYKLIANQYVARWGLYTVSQIIPVYAPASDNNNEAAYIQAIEKAVDTWRSGMVEV